MMVTNNTTLISSRCTSSSLAAVDVAVSCLYFLVFLISLPLNGMAAWVSLQLRSTSTFIVYLKNLVAADLLLTLMLPLTAAGRLPGATKGLKMSNCRFSSVIFYFCLYTSIALMGLISLDRFFKIVRPDGKAIGQSVAFSLVTSTLVWVVLFGTTVVPTIILTDQDPGNITDGNFCMSMKRPTGVTLHKFVVLSMKILFWLVSILIVFCYICITVKVLQSFRNSGSNNSQGKKKIKLRVFLILLVFFVCFVPFHIMRVPLLALSKFTDSEGCTQMRVLIAHKLVLWLSSTNACLDPLLYIYLCREFKDKLVDMVKSRGVCVNLFSDEKEESSE